MNRNRLSSYASWLTSAFVMAIVGTWIPGCSGENASSDNGTTGTISLCGNGAIDIGEDCDDGANNSDTSGCTTKCKFQICGDGFVDPDVEECDLGAVNADTGDCTSWCRIPSCGDNLVHAGVEECDSGKDNSNNGSCTLKCKNAYCGDGFVETGIEECDLGTKNSPTGMCTPNCKLP